MVLFGDVAARHSPLTSCGFGRMRRSFGPAADAIARAPDGPGEIYGLEPIHAGTGALSRMLSDPPTDDPGAMNALLDVAFEALYRGGEAYYGRMLRDEMTMAEFVAFLWRTSLRRPRVYRDVFASLGVADVARWGAGVVAGLAGAGR
jgi:lycopene cyclase CruA